MTFLKTFSPNVQAFLDMIAWCEGTIDIGDNGYNCLFGATASRPKVFTDYSDHPRIKTYETHDNFIKNGKLDFTTAAGRYQLIKGMYDILRRRLGLSDFSPASQDLMALYLIKEKCPIKTIKKGNLETAIRLVAPTWASLPTSRADQGHRTLADCRQAFVKYGGRFSPDFAEELKSEIKGDINA